MKDAVTEFPHRHGIESIAQRLYPHVLILAASASGVGKPVRRIATLDA
jgi:hypothetical protein